MKFSNRTGLLISHSVPILCLEENAPAIFLSPRNFNPHPYVATFHSRNGRLDEDRNTGPVLFPSSPDENNEIDSNTLNYRERERIFNHPIDDHPYEKVARRNRFLVRGRFSGEEDRINPKIFEALSNYASKVLSRPSSQLANDYDYDRANNNDYAFSYKVVDYSSGDDFSHSQSQKSRTTNGEYKVKLPDGRVQTVSYVADKNGYKADVKYTQDSPVAIPKSISQNYRYDNAGDSFLRSKSVLLGPRPTEIPVQYDYDETFLYGAQQQRRQPNVEIFVNNRDISRDGGYFLSTTAAPYYFSTTAQPDYESVTHFS